MKPMDTPTTPEASRLPLPARRKFLREAGLGCGALALASLLYEEGLLAADAPAAPEPEPATTGPLALKPTHFPPRAKSVIWLFMTGGPSQVDLFDYKPELQKRDGQTLAGADPKTGFFSTSGKCLKSPFNFAQHGQSGAWVSDLFPRTAQHVDDMAFLYSCFSSQNNHAPASMEITTGFERPGYPSIGSWLSYGLGSLNRNLPSYVVLHDAKPRGEDGIWSSGYLPANFQPVLLDARQQERIPNLSPRSGLTAQQQQAQLAALARLNQRYSDQHPEVAELAARIDAFELAYRMQIAAPEALDLTQESAETKTLYGTENKDCGTFGRQCLIARRLVERGVRFVQVFCPSNRISGGAVADVPWDGHNDIQVNHRDCAMMTDQPVAALLTDLKARGLLKDTLVIWGGEFGRTSDSQGSVGRDHNPHANTTWMAGGGVKGGVHYGRTDEFGYKAVENRVSVYDLQATVLHLLGLDHTRLTYRFNGRDFRLTDVHGHVVKEILA